MKNKIESLLLDVKRICDKNQEIVLEKKKKGQMFNIFKTTCLVANETQLHSALLVELLNPNGSHGQNGKFLACFVDILKEKGIIKNFNLNCELASVGREIFIGWIDKEHKNGGRLDIEIQFGKKYGIIIENKIYADDEKNQLIRYKNYAEKKYEKYAILYLTLFGDSPSKKSCGQIEKGKKFWYEISYDEEICDWLNRCLEGCKDIPSIEQIIIQYSDVIDELTGNILEDEMSEDLIQLLMKNDNLKIAENLTPQIIRETKNKIIEKNLFPLLKNYKSDEGWEFQEANGTDKFDIQSYDKKDMFLFSISKRDVYISFAFACPNGQDLFYGIWTAKSNKTIQNLFKDDFEKHSYNWQCWNWADDDMRNWDTSFFVNNLLNQPEIIANKVKKIIDEITVRLKEIGF